jgi:hypothetical protein
MKYILFSLLVMSVQTAHSQDWQEVGIDKSKFNAHAQEKDSWCWAAGIQMILQYNHIDKSQEEIVERAYGRRYDGTLPNLGASAETISNNLTNWHVDITGRDLVVNSSLFRGIPQDEDIVQYLAGDQPILISYRSSISSNHAVVITSCRYEETSSGPKIKQITVSDPWPSKINVRNDGVVTYDFDRFRDLIDFYWIVSSRVKGYTHIANDAFDQCSTPFCLCLQKVLKGFDNGFADIRGRQSSATIYRSSFKFPGEQSDYFSITKTPMYYVSFYRGTNSDSADITFQTIKANFKALKFEEGSWNAQGGSMDSHDKTVKFLLESDKMIVLKWVNSGGRYSVQMLIQTKETDF